MSTERALIPIRILEGQAVDDDLAALLDPIDVVLLGFHEVPEQTAPSQMRQEFEERARVALDSIADDFEGPVETRLVFTPDRDESIERVAADVGATIVAHPNPLRPVTSMLLVIDGPTDPTRLAECVAAIRAGRDIRITVLGVAGDEVSDLGNAVETARETLVAAAVPPTDIETRTVAADSLVDAVVDAAVGHDVTVMGEHAPDWRTVLFGEVEERVAAESLGPVLEVLRGRPDEQ